MSKRKKAPRSKKKNILSQQVLYIFAGEPFSKFNYKQVASRLGFNDPISRNLVKQFIQELVSDGALEQEGRGKYKLNPDYMGSHSKNRMVEGVVDMKQTGKAYIGTPELDEDIFISPNNTKNALHKDRVKVFLFPRRKGRKLEGQIIEVLERGINQFVGKLEVSSHYAFLVPDSPSITVDFFIPLGDLKGGKNGDKAIATITEWPEHSKNPFGKVTDLLGKPGDNDVEMNSILASLEYPLRFPKSVLDETERISEQITSKDRKDRRDFRDVTTFTIDPLDAKDFDDALSVKKLSGDDWEVGIHIADVSHYVKPGTPLDQEAYRRGTSVYLADRVIPMLPEKLSNMVCSLRPNEDKLTFSVVFKINNQGTVLDKWLGKSVIRSNERFTYQQVQETIETGSGRYKEEVLKLNELAQILRRNRFENGSLAFHSTEVGFELDENKKPIKAFIKEQKESNHLVEEFMLLANKKVAEHIAKPGKKEKPKTFIYRIHDEPNPEKLANMADFVSQLGYKMNIGSRKSITNSINNLFEKVKGTSEQNLIETIAVRTMAKAEYSTDNIGHYGLSFKYYSHFTSPIRRYPDLMAHRLLFSYLSGGNSVNSNEYEEMCQHTSLMERRAIEAERESVKFKQVEFLEGKIGEGFVGTITGVSKWGIFVELLENHCEGMVPLQTMKDDFYFLDEDNYRVVGHKHKQIYQLGDIVNVVVKDVNLSKKQMEFILSE